MNKRGKRAGILAFITIVLTALLGVAGAGTASACSPTGSSTRYAATLPQVSPGQSGDLVLGLQLNLRDRGYALNGTGLYADNTLAAVQDFQRRNGINPSGIVGSKTWQALVGTLNQNATGNGPTPDQPQLSPGSTDQDPYFHLINALQRIHPYQGFEEQYYGPRTQSMVRDFQRRVGIKDSGIVGPKTWAALYQVVSVSGHWGC
ncbi:peptidoglycan-binding protein [Actinokineospora sp. NBRC 105648]|uniref:peptidoglycan-binding domain-containing protein n=1 Tax=Actinokineospora sp. NBRC 105648 TaxID=3032206 RepID=UPI0024A4CB32|nr:peptidoglycan-binding protein [Actinokineospora sp. NBRC 105648]GLZ36968.1 hypothetical protein Acsp05_05930 [Actinokineospora sp. NBRC 105648]